MKAAIYRTTDFKFFYKNFNTLEELVNFMHREDDIILQNVEKFKGLVDEDTKFVIEIYDGWRE